VYRLEYCHKEEWIPLQKYKNLSRMKANFLMGVCALMKKEETLKKLRIAKDE
jgi:hypothetical protein|tara:strand:- start:950 stop:1105 length:156 start_codon:yes stop_codon:yes gene_type:complete